MTLRPALTLVGGILLAACSTTPPAPPTPSSPAVDTPKGTNSRSPTRRPNVVLKKGGGFYKDDGPGDEIPDGLDEVPDAEPKWEPLHKPALKPYVVLGKEYVPFTSLRPYRVRGIASWYGKKFHGQKTSIGEPYDMFGMTAAHPILPLPSYARVTNVQNGRSVIVRLTDRGPFHADRVIDLSYTAAYKLGLVGNGSGEVEVEAILPGEPTGTTYAQVQVPARPAGEDREFDQLARRLAADMESPPVASTSAASPAVPPARGIYLQLGAFANSDNADSLRAHLNRELDWLGEPMRIYPGGGLHRLQLGPYASRGDAERIADRIRSQLGYKPTIVVR